MIQYNFPTIVLFGENSITELPYRIDILGLKNCMLVTDSGLVSAGIVEQFKTVFEGTLIKLNIFYKKSKFL